MQVWINGEVLELTAQAVVLDALEAIGAARPGVAVAVDGAVVPRDSWAATPLQPEARIEVLTAVQGG